MVDRAVAFPVHAALRLAADDVRVNHAWGVFVAGKGLPGRTTLRILKHISMKTREFQKADIAPSLRTAIERIVVPVAQGQRTFQKWSYIIVLLALVLLALKSLLPLPNEYASSWTLWGLPVLAWGDAPVGWLAVGVAAIGIVAIGAFSVGVVSIGGLSVGLIAIGGLGAGLFLAIGGLAAGYYSVGGYSVGAFSYAGGGSARGLFVAQGGQSEHLWGEHP